MIDMEFEKAVIYVQEKAMGLRPDGFRFALMIVIAAAKKSIAKKTK